MSKRASTSTEEPDPKRSKCIPGIEEEYTCSITLALFINPVFAEDGHLYEHAAINRHFEQTRWDTCNSPMTNETMGKRVFQAVQVRNMIARLIKEDLIPTELAVAWLAGTKKMQDDREYVATLKALADGGDMEATSELGIAYYRGKRGLYKDSAKVT